MRGRFVRSRGFTLVEVLLALVVTVSALAILSQGLMTGGRASSSAQNGTRAALVAERVIAGLETGEITLTSISNQSFDDEPTFLYDIQYDLDPDQNTLDDVTVTVRWKEMEQDRSFVLMRILRDPSTTAASSSTTTTPTPPKSSP